jgi:hypothetical protein
MVFGLRCVLQSLMDLSKLAGSFLVSFPIHCQAQVIEKNPKSRSTNQTLAMAEFVGVASVTSSPTLELLHLHGTALAFPHSSSISSL